VDSLRGMAYNMGRLKRAGFCKIYMDLPSPRTSGYNQNWLPWALSLAAVALMTAALCFEGRIWWCQHGDSAIYINDAWSTHTSQHFLDPYSFTHILHGVMFFWIAALVACGRRSQASEELLKLARACALKNWAFTEWLHGKTYAPRGMPGQSWNAAAFLMAQHAVEQGPDSFFDAGQRLEFE